MFSPLVMDSFTTSMNVSTVARTVTRSIPVFSAMAATISAFVIFLLSYGLLKLSVANRTAKILFFIKKPKFIFRGFARASGPSFQSSGTLSALICILHSGVPLRSCLKFLTILKRLNFQGPVSGFCLPIGGYSGSGLPFSRPIAGYPPLKNAAPFLQIPSRCFKQINLNSFLNPNRSLDFG